MYNVKLRVDQMQLTCSTQTGLCHLRDDFRHSVSIAATIHTDGQDAVALVPGIVSIHKQSHIFFY